MEGKEIEGRKLRVRSAKDSDKKKSNETTRENRGDERAQEQKLVVTRNATDIVSILCWRVYFSIFGHWRVSPFCGHHN